jgi:hypothetical protein
MLEVVLLLEMRNDALDSLRAFRMVAAAAMQQSQRVVEHSGLSCFHSKRLLIGGNGGSESSFSFLRL